MTDCINKNGKYHLFMEIFQANKHECVCHEETLLYQMVSGLHTSVNMHIDSNFYDAERDLMYANYTRYYEHFGSHPERI